MWLSISRYKVEAVSKRSILPCARGQNVMEFPMLQVRRNFSVLEDREALEQMAWGSGGISAAGNHCRGRERQVCQK